MLDTVVLSIPMPENELQRRHLDGSSIWSLQGRKAAFDTYIREAPVPDGSYFPKVTAFRRKSSNGSWGVSLRIEFSAPKILYGNNIEELTEDQFEEVAVILHGKLTQLGLTIEIKDLNGASVRAVHYSRNVEVVDGYTAMYAIGEIGKINLNSRFDLARTRYMNDGQSLCMYTRSHSFVIYDKVADLLRGKGKAIDVTQSKADGELAVKMNGTELLRFEVRLCEKRKMNSVLRKNGFTENPTFRDVFSANISVAILQQYWGTLVAGQGHVLFAHAPTPKDVLKYLLLAKPKVVAREAIFLTGLLLLIRDGNGIRELRTLLRRHMVDRTWYRMAAQIKQVEAEMATLQPRGWYGQITSALQTYKPFRTSEPSSKGVKLTV